MARDPNALVQCFLAIKKDIPAYIEDRVDDTLYMDDFDIVINTITESQIEEIRKIWMRNVNN